MEYGKIEYFKFLNLILFFSSFDTKILCVENNIENSDNNLLKGLFISQPKKEIIVGYFD